jgi:hypothetical protein
MNYEKKYLKYKSKYIQLNNQIGGTLEEDEALEINAAFPGLSVSSTTVDEIYNIIYMCTILNLYKKENFSLIDQTKIIKRLLTYLTNYEHNVESLDVRSIIDNYYIFLLETLIVTINNSNPTIPNQDFFFIPNTNENMTALLTFINNNKNFSKYINLTLKLINVIIDKMSIIDYRLYKSHPGENFLFIITAIIFLKKNISEAKTNYSITKVKEYIKKLKSKNELITYLRIQQDGEKLVFPYSNERLLDKINGLNVTQLEINEILKEYFELI